MSAPRKIQTWPTLKEDLPLLIQRSLGQSKKSIKHKKKDFGNTWQSERLTIGNVAAYEGAHDRWDTYIKNQANINVSDPYLHNHSHCTESLWDSEPNLYKSRCSIKSNTSSSGSSSSSAASLLLELEQPMQPRRRQSITPLEMVHNDSMMLNQPELDFGYQDIHYQPF